jgi:hypothetical protein
MDGDGHNAKVFTWHEDDDGKPLKAFDPSAVLRAIEDEDEEVAPPSAAKPPADTDLGAALRAAMDYGIADEDGEDDPLPLHTAGEDGDETGADADWHEEDGEDADDGEEEERAIGEPFEASEDAPGFDEETPEEVSLSAPASPARACPPMNDLDVPGRKPRVALMGEFSAGKSTLSNLLIGAAPLPMKVTATQLPPVWISWGDGQAYREDLDGGTHPIDVTRLSEIDPSETRMIRIFAKSDVLDMCDIIDMPGISDPNMDSAVWERVIGKADAVLWCTHATQAWRQSEASVWESLDPALHLKSLLLVTRFDKLHGESDRARVMRRVERETEGLFLARLPISLTEALSAGDDEDLLEKSGAAAFRRQLVALLDSLARGSGRQTADRAGRTAETLERDGLVAGFEDSRAARGITPSRILPRRIRPVSEPASARALPDDRDHGL